MSAVFVRPDYEDLTHYVSVYLKGAVDNAKALGFQVQDLYGEDAVEEEFLKALENFNPYVVCIGSHGLEDVLYGQEGGILLKSCINDDVLTGKVCFALACRTASKLGPSSVNKGCLAYFGWLEDFVVIMDESYPPLQDPYAYSFFRPVLAGIDVLFRDVSAEATVQTLARDVYETVVKTFNEEIEYWKSIPTFTASQMVTYLIHDRDTFIPITATGVYTPPSMVAAELWKPFLIVGILALPLFVKGLGE